MANDDAIQPASVNYCAVTPPDNFNFRQPETWTKWKTRFDRYRSISGLSSRDDVSQVDALLYTMGEGAEDIISALQLTPEEKGSYAAVTAKLDGYFLPKRNVIFERAQFNRRRQEPHETVDMFVTDLHRLSDTCEFGPLRDELIRDRMVVGILDAKLSETLQLDPALTLESALTKARNSESVKKQQAVLRNGEDKSTGNGNVDTFFTPSHNKKPKHFNQPSRGRRQKTKEDSTQSSHYVGPTKAPCNWCGSNQQHAKQACPAYDKICSKCQKKGHFARVCRSSPTTKGQSFVPRNKSTALEEVAIGAVGEQAHEPPWLIDTKVGNNTLTFKIDTGADVTVISEKEYKTGHFPKLSPPDKILLAPARQPLDTVGMFVATLTTNKCSTQQSVYVVRKLQQNLLGRPAIRALGLLVAVPEVSSSVPPQNCQLPDPREHFPQLFSGLGCLGNEYEYKIKLRDDAQPFAITTPRRVPIPMLPMVKQELARMESLGVIRRIEEATEWCSPMVIARKRDGQIRICSSYEALNKQLVRERTVMPTVDESLGKLANAKIFSKIDGRWGFWQIPLAEESQKLTTFITPFGRYVYQRLPFGISSAPEHFQAVMSQLLEDLPGQVCQLDDILVHGQNTEDHNKHLFPVLQRLQDRGLTLNADKCEFYKEEVTFLGHTLNSKGISADPRKTKAILEMASPKNVSEVRAFLGMVNHLAKFVEDLSHKTKPLRDLLRSDSAWIWGEPQRTAFAQIKQELTQPPVLTLYDPAREHVVSADASSYGLGAVLFQVDTDGQRRPVAFASRSLTDTEQRYAQVEKEALASVWACNRFRTYLLGLHFELETDHKPLVAILDTKRLDELTPRLQRLRLRLMGFSYHVTFVPGKELFSADVLSRAPISSVDPDDAELSQAIDEFELLSVEMLPASDIRLAEIMSGQKSDPVISQVRQYSTSQWPVKSALSSEVRPYAEVADELCVVQGILLKGNRIVVPPPLREDILHRLHEGHQGIARTRARALLSVWWPSISSHIADFVRTCPTCCKFRHSPTEPLLSTPLPDRPWQVVGSDLFENEHRRYLVVVDYFSRFFELEELSSTTSTAIINKLKFIYARHGIPEVIRSDNGPQYSSGQFALFCKEYGVKHVTSSPTYAQSNGEAERTVQTAKSIVRKSKDLALGLLAHRSTPAMGGMSPAQLLYGRNIRTTVPSSSRNLAPKWPNLQKFRKADERSKRKQAETYNSRHRVREQPKLPHGTGVWIKDLKRPARVLHPCPQPRSYVVETDTGNVRRTRSHLQPCPVAEQPAPPTVAEHMPAQVQVGRPQAPHPRDQGSSSRTPNVKRTRAGRTTQPPKRLNL